MSFSTPLYRGDSCSTRRVKGDVMNGELKKTFGEGERAAMIWNRLWSGRGVIIKCAVIFTACACSAFARGQSASPAQAPLTVESPQEMQARIPKLEAEVSELKAIVSHMQPAAATAAPAVVVAKKSRRDNFIGLYSE